jgi:hypothetical protein
VGIVTEALIALVTGAVTGVLGLLGGYVFGVLRTLSESRNERRDAALAEIFKEMDLFHRYLGSWADDPTPGPNAPSAASKASGIPTRKHVSDQYNKFVLAFHGNAIWLGKDTYDLIQEFSAEGMDLLNGLSSTMAGATHLPDGTRSKARWKDQIDPKFKDVRDALRAEVEASRSIIPHRIAIKKNGARQRRTDPGGGE